jgi:hypothetical protein
MDLQWQPEQEPLKQLAGFLKDSLSGYNRAAQKNAEAVSLILNAVDIEGNMR